jgi:hypothetical protein
VMDVPVSQQQIQCRNPLAPIFSESGESSQKSAEKESQSE